MHTNKPIGNDLVKVFELNHTETELYFAIQAMLIGKDIDATTDKECREKKKFWRDKYYELIQSKKFGKINIFPPEEISKRLKSVTKCKREIILFEARIFTPYFNLNIRHKNLDGLKKGYQENTQTIRTVVDNLAADHEVNPQRIQSCEKAYMDAIKEMRGDWSTLEQVMLVAFLGIIVAATAGYGATAIGTYIGSLMGLSGCAATSAGLAFLGGGALAVGGYGMAGGVVVIIGGGFIIGGATATGMLMLIDNDSSLVLLNVAKLEAVLKVLLSEEPGILDLVEKTIKSYSQSVRRIKSTLEEIGIMPEAKTDEEKKDKKRRVTELEKSMEYYKKGMQRIVERFY